MLHTETKHIEAQRAPKPFLEIINNISIHEKMWSIVMSKRTCTTPNQQQLGWYRECDGWMDGQTD